MPIPYMSPFDAMFQANQRPLELQGMQTKNALQSVQAQQAQMELDNMNALRKAMADSINPDGTPDLNKVTTNLIQFGKSDLATNVMSAQRQQEMFNIGKGYMQRSQQPQSATQQQQSPEAQNAITSASQMSPRDMQVLSANVAADQKKNPNTPIQFVGQTQDTPQFGSGIALNQAGLNAGAAPIQQPQTQQQPQGGVGPYGLPLDSMAFDMMSGHPEKIGDHIFELSKPLLAREGGIWTKDPITGQPKFAGGAGKIPEGASLDQNMNLRPYGGFMDFENILGQLKKTIENRNSPQMVINPATGREQPKTKQQIIDEANAGAQGEIQPPGFVTKVPGINQPAQPLPNVPSVGGIGGYGQTPQEKKLSESRGENIASSEKKINEEADLALNKIVQNNKMIGLLPQVELGPLSARITNFKAMMKEMGINLPGKDPTSSQEYEKYAYQGAIAGAKQAFGARITNLEVDTLIKSSPGRNITEQANNALLKFDNIVQQRKLDRQSKFYQYQGQGGDLNQFDSWYNQNSPLEGMSAPKTGESADQSAPSVAPNKALTTQQIVDELRKRGKIK